MRKTMVSLCLTITVALSACSDDGCGPKTKLPSERSVLLHPDSSAFKNVPPDTFYVKMATSKGDVVIEVIREWSPMGAYRFYNLVRNGFFDGARFFRVVPEFAAQFGASGFPEVEEAWSKENIPADPMRISNTKGMVSFAQRDKDTRSTQLFFNLQDNTKLDEEHFTPIGRVVKGWSAVHQLYDEYGELKPDGDGPAWKCIYKSGNDYLRRMYPRLDTIARAQLLDSAAARAGR